MKQFNYHIDPGHGWVQVSHYEMKKLGVDYSKISPYSFQNETYYFLEEDCDAKLFWDAHLSHYGTKPELKEVYHDESFDKR